MKATNERRIWRIHKTKTTKTTKSQFSESLTSEENIASLREALERLNRGPRTAINPWFEKSEWKRWKHEHPGRWPGEQKR